MRYFLGALVSMGMVLGCGTQVQAATRGGLPASWLRGMPDAGLSLQPKSQAVGECANFEGKWIGKCQWGNGESESDTVEFRSSSCSDVDLGGVIIHFGGKTTLVTTSLRDTATIDFAADWNAGRTGFVAVVDANYRMLGKTGRSNSTGQVQMEIIGTQLIQRVKFNVRGIHENGELYELQSTQDCEYTRAP